MKLTAYLTLVIFLLPACGDKNKPEPPNTADHRCASCGMLTANYPPWEQMIIKDSGDTLWFDGARCMLKLYLEGKALQEEPTGILVKDYYDQVYIDGRQAYYVIGSDVFGPMGHELIPFESLDAAKSFLSDHHGRRILRFDQVDLKLVRDLAGGIGM